ncbi:hypothetical protein [Helicobacter sp. T3_23-1056]
MGSIKYFIVGFLAVGLFVGGAFFMRLSEQKDSFLGNKEKSHFSQTLTSQKQLPVELYVGAFGFKSISQNPNSQEIQLIKNTLASAIERARREQKCQGGDFDLQKNSNKNEKDAKSEKTDENNAIDFSIANNLNAFIGGVIECKFNKDEFASYQAMLKDIDYLALKSGVLRLANYGIEPLITQEQLSNASKEVYAELSKEIKKQQSAIEGGFGVKCEIARVEFFDDAYRQNLALQGHHSAMLKNMGASGINKANADFLKESSIADFALPLQSSKNVEFKSFISFKCK